jgi:hypothetical protein
MEFFIRQGATDPILKMKLIDDGKNDKSSFNDLLDTSTITFEMFDVKTNEYSILNSPCLVTTRTKKYNQTTDEYYITHRFTTGHTLNQGRYEGKINIVFSDGNTLITPIKEKLFINII